MNILKENPNQHNLLRCIAKPFMGHCQFLSFIIGMKQSLHSCKMLLLFVLLIGFTSCKNKLPIEQDFSKINYQLVDNDNRTVNFFKDFKGKTIVAGYIFTNCPDICPLTTNNMRLVQETLTEDEMKDVQFISISFDPEVDTPETLTKFAEIRNLDLSNWTFLTGSKPVIDSLMKDVGVVAILGDSTITPSGEKINYFVHTDRISLIDKNLQLRKNYIGSKAEIQEIVNDINALN
jgi:protein SCO1/2